MEEHIGKLDQRGESSMDPGEQTPTTNVPKSIGPIVIGRLFGAPPSGYERPESHGLTLGTSIPTSALVNTPTLHESL